ncbi:VWA domain-containing protein [Hansschlegelia quercus]
MTMLDGFALLRPWWLLGVPVAALILLVAVRRTGGVGDWRRAVDAHLLDALARRGGVVAGKGRAAILAAATAGLIALALTGPAVERQGVADFRNLDIIVIAIDLSRSVAESPQFNEAKIAALAAAEAAGTRQVALIAYAGDAYLVSPPSTDRKGLETTLFALDGTTVPDLGSAPTRALALARNVLKEAGVVAGDVALVTDGGGIDEGTRGEARALRADGHALSALYVTPKAATGGLPGPRVAGRVELDALVSAGGGSVGDIANAGAVDERLSRDETSRLGAGSYASLVWSDLGRWLLLAAAFPMLMLFRRCG